MTAKAGVASIIIKPNKLYLAAVTGVARFFMTRTSQNGEKYTKLSQHYQMVINYNKWPNNIPNGHKIYQPFPFLGFPKFTQIGIFGLKIYHLARVARFFLVQHTKTGKLYKTATNHTK
jgi:hypothetical protein